MNHLIPDLFNDLKKLIERGKDQIATTVNSTVVLTYWHVGKRINDEILHGERAQYGKQIVESVAVELSRQFGCSFESKNLRRMMQFAELFADLEIVVPLARQLSWSHFLILIPLKNNVVRLKYAQAACESSWSKRELRSQIERKSIERMEIADTKHALMESNHLRGTFKDPYLFDFLGLRDGFLENDLESALVRELELFIMELGKGFTFVERQKRMVIDGEDFSLDLLFYHRKLKRLVAVELKINRFKAAFKGQMELYLNWLNKHERQPGEEAPIGLILCTEAGTEQVELLNLQKDNIVVAEYWTELPPKELLEQKLHTALIEVQERLTERNLLEQELSMNSEKALTVASRASATGILNSTMDLGTSATGIRNSTMDLGASATGIRNSTMDLGTSATGLGTSATGLGTSATGLGTSATGIRNSTMDLGTSATGIRNSGTRPQNSTTDLGTGMRIPAPESLPGLPEVLPDVPEVLPDVPEVLPEALEVLPEALEGNEERKVEK